MTAETTNSRFDTDTSKPALGHDRRESREKLPLVSIVMPVRNEAFFIERSLRAVLRQEYPAERLEVIVVDGMSDDGTRNVIERVLETSRAEGKPLPDVRLLNNPDRIVPSALNTGIQDANGEIIIRVDGHCEIAADFVRQDVALLREHPEAWSVGGPIVHAARTPFGKAAAAAMSHPLGIGSANHRFKEFEGYAEGAAFPAIRRTVFERIGEFDEEFVRNQDDEFNYRMRQAGGKIFISPRVEYVYFVRERMSLLFKQYYQYGFWRVSCIRKHRRPFHVRQLIPSLFLASILILVLLSVLVGELLIALLLPSLYVLMLVGAALTATPHLGLAVALRLPSAIVALHAGYSLGFLVGLGGVASSQLSEAARRRASTLSR